MTMRRLAESASYSSWQPMNLQYGLLAVRIGRAAGKRGIWLGDLVEFIAPKGRGGQSLSNSEHILVMRPHFAAALRASSWLP